MDYDKIRAALTTATTDDQLLQAIVDAPFTVPTEAASLSLGITVLLKHNNVTSTIDRVALSNTELAKNTTTVSAKPFHEITIPADDLRNIIAEAIRSNTPQETNDWDLLFTPDLPADEARLNQASAGIAYSAVYPLRGFPDGAAMIFSYYQHSVQASAAQHEFMQQYVRLVAERVRAKR